MSSRGPPSAGSSPLARGLLDYDGGVSARLRIIPARAGFTGGDPHRGGRRGDHPRSRGVYGESGSRPKIGLGSSPLARGLLELIVADLAGDRIIPARAGFTSIQTTVDTYGQDHPRSRGVYCLPAGRTRVSPGSSPLARGLPIKACVDGLVDGIIPARAGFTGRGPDQGQTHRDHPRSRGVYENFEVERRIVFGSSPLARGLRLEADGRRRRHRIIPARAGFTHHHPHR